MTLRDLDALVRASTPSKVNIPQLKSLTWIRWSCALELGFYTSAIFAVKCFDRGNAASFLIRSPRASEHAAFVYITHDNGTDEVELHVLCFDAGDLREEDEAFVRECRNALLVALWSEELLQVGNCQCRV